MKKLQALDNIFIRASKKMYLKRIHKSHNQFLQQFRNDSITVATMLSNEFSLQAGIVFHYI